jgi:hypothetical protein
MMKSLENLVRKAYNWKSTRKPYLDRYLDPALTYIAGNAAMLYYANKGLNMVSDSFPGYEGPAMLGAYALLATGIGAANRYVLRSVGKRIAKFHETRIKKRKIVNFSSVIRTAGQIGALTGLMLYSNFAGTVRDYKWDAQRVTDAFARKQAATMVDYVDDDTKHAKQSKTLIDMMPKNLYWSQVENSSIRSPIGKFYRTYRWNDALTKTERKYHIQPGLLSGLVMTESMGNPLQLNYTNGGDAGLMQFMPGTAQQCGLKTYGDSNKTGTDRYHGRRLQSLVKSMEYDYDKLSKIDERFDVSKSIDAGGRYLSDLYKKYGDWNLAISAWNRGKPASDPTCTNHVKATRYNQQYYLAHVKSIEKQK